MSVEESDLPNRASIIEEFLHLLEINDPELEDYYLEEKASVLGG